MSVTQKMRDPVCGMAVDPERALAATYQGEQFYFDAEYCKNAFLANPERYAGERPAPLKERDPAARRIAYFSMEVGVDPRLPIYSGGLGILAGDTLRSLADLKIPAVGVSLLYANGYFEQTLDRAGNQGERPVIWKPASERARQATTMRQASMRS
jgi:starch phosphorylase